MIEVDMIRPSHLQYFTNTYDVINTYYISKCMHCTIKEIPLKITEYKVQTIIYSNVCKNIERTYERKSKPYKKVDLVCLFVLLVKLFTIFITPGS